MPPHPGARALCPSCREPAPDRLDPDLKVCPPCRERLRWEMSEWLKQLVGMGVLGTVPEPREHREPRQQRSRRRDART
ncbi:hypothetical protein ACFQ1I_19920 [Kitasatospora arboriphila]